MIQINEHSLTVRRTEELKNRSARRCARQIRIAAVVGVILFAVAVNIILAHRDPSDAQLDAAVALAAARADANAELKGLQVK